MRIALYTRVSTDKQEVTNQLLQLRQWCAAAGHEVVIEYIDDGISGKTAKRRPAFVRMMDEARKRHFDLLVFWSLDRLSREGAVPVLNHLQMLDSYGVQWRSHTEPFFDSCGPFKEAVIAIIGTVAKLERVKISERTKAGLARTKARGTVLGRRADAAAYEAVRRAHGGQPDASARALARITGSSRTTVARALAAGAVLHAQRA